jgi:hypothetical protein
MQFRISDVLVPKSTINRVAILVCGLLLLCGQAAQSQAVGHASKAASPQLSQPTLMFMMNADLYLNGLETNNPTIGQLNPNVPIPTGQDLVNHFFKNRTSILFTLKNNEDPVPSGWQSIPAMKFSAYSAFQSAVSGGIDGSIALVIYDNEEWGSCTGGSSNATPQSEQEQPATYTADFYNLANQHGYQFMGTPSRDLTKCQVDYSSGSIDNFYLAQSTYACSGNNYPCGSDYAGHPDRPFPYWAANAAGGANANVYIDIQAQAHMSDGSYTTFTTSAQQEATAANSSVKILAGLSTNYGDSAGVDMYNAVTGTYTLPNMVGYWINLTQSTSDYQQVLNFLYRLYNAGF